MNWKARRVKNEKTNVLLYEIYFYAQCLVSVVQSMNWMNCQWNGDEMIYGSVIINLEILLKKIFVSKSLELYLC